MGNLRDILQLVIGCLNDGPFAQEQIVHQRQQSILHILTNGRNQLNAAGKQCNDYAFVYGPVWFTRLGEGVVPSAMLGENDFLVSGYWVGWQASGAAGNPIVVHGSYEDNDTILIGLDATFRAHPENTFRLLGNAIYNGLE